MLHSHPHSMDSDDDAEEWIPPANFCMVERGLYRSARTQARSRRGARHRPSHLDAGAGGFPKKKNFPFLRHLRLKTIL